MIERLDISFHTKAIDKHVKIDAPLMEHFVISSKLNPREITVVDT